MFCSCCCHFLFVLLFKGRVEVFAPVVVFGHVGVLLVLLSFLLILLFCLCCLVVLVLYSCCCDFARVVISCDFFWRFSRVVDF